MTAKEAVDTLEQIKVGFMAAFQKMILTDPKAGESVQATHNLFTELQKFIEEQDERISIMAEGTPDGCQVAGKMPC